MHDYNEYGLSEKDCEKLKELKRKNKRRKAFWTLLGLQAGSLIISYFLGRSHKD